MKFTIEMKTTAPEGTHSADVVKRRAAEAVRALEPAKEDHVGGCCSSPAQEIHP